MTGPRIVFLLGFLGLAACSGAERDITLHDMRSGKRQPEEFSILPVKPLQQPESYAELPTPTPGDANLSDPTPKADAVAALGGRPGLLSTSGVPASDAAIVNHASRFGRQADIRAVLAAEDLELRRRKSRFTWSIVPRDDYRRAYRSMLLKPYAELYRFRQAGVRTPSAPPEDD